MKNPFMPRIASLAEGCILQRKLTLVTVDDVLPVIWKESMGIEWFNPSCGCDPLFKANMAALNHATGISQSDWLRAIQVKTGPNRGAIPKFRFEPSYWQWAQVTAPRAKMFGASAAMLACSWGVGQKMARWYLANEPEHAWFAQLELFNSDVRLQVDAVAKDMEYLLRISAGYRPLAFSRYNAGPTHKTVTEYGKQVNDERESLMRIRKAMA
jgi:hypothetical protein